MRSTGKKPDPKLTALTVTTQAMVACSSPVGRSPGAQRRTGGFVDRDRACVARERVLVDGDEPGGPRHGGRRVTDVVAEARRHIHRRDGTDRRIPIGRRGCGYTGPMERKHPFGWIVPRDWMVDELDEGETAVAAFSVVKRVDESGTSAWSVRIAGDEVSDEERYGAIAAVVHGLRLELQSDWSGGPPAGDDVDGRGPRARGRGRRRRARREGEDGDDDDLLEESEYTAFANLFPIAWVTEPLPEDTEAVAIFAVIKTRDVDGSLSWATRMAGAEVSSEELYGTLDPLAATLLDELAAGWG